MSSRACSSCISGPMTTPSSSPRDCAPLSIRPRARRAEVQSGIGRHAGSERRSSGGRGCSAGRKAVLDCFGTSRRRDSVLNEQKGTAMAHPFRITAAVLASLGMLTDTSASAQSADSGPLQLEAKILLGDVRGRIDHMAIDLKRQRLFVAELGNDSVGVVDLANRTLIRTIAGLNEPQGVGYEPSTDTLYVANARDGSVKLFDGNAYNATGQIELGGDADNIRIDSGAKRVAIGYGDGALAFIDSSTRGKVQNAPLKAHPESFQIFQDRIFVNLPNSHAVAVVDAKSGKQVASWPMGKSGNFAMTVDPDRSRILVV